MKSPSSLPANIGNYPPNIKRMIADKSSDLRLLTTIAISGLQIRLLDDSLPQSDSGGLVKITCHLG
jgi:hypothetical protein